MVGEEEEEGIGEGEDIWLWLSEEADVINRGSRRECRCPTFMAAEETQVEVSKIKDQMSFVHPSTETATSEVTNAEGLALSTLPDLSLV